MDWPLETDFNALFPERKPLYSNHLGDFSLGGQRVLITGAAGSIGSALALKILRDTPERLVLLDHSEQAIYDFQREFPPNAREGVTRFIFGDIRDGQLLQNLLENEKPDVIFHAAAFKHVPLLEDNPFAAIENNGRATWELAQKAAAHGVPRLLLVSTDKAANPQSMLGISKRLAELAILRWNSERTQMSAVRLGNVAGSSGSVLPIFGEQIQRGGPVEVTHRDATRYFLTIDEASDVIGKIASA